MSPSVIRFFVAEWGPVANQAVHKRNDEKRIARCYDWRIRYNSRFIAQNLVRMSFAHSDYLEALIKVTPNWFM